MGQYLSTGVHGAINGAFTAVALTAMADGAKLSLPVIVAVGITGLFTGAIIISLSTFITAKTDEDRDSQAKSSYLAAMIDLITYLFVGLIPISTFLVAFYYQIQSPWLFTIAYTLAGLSLFITGLFKGLMLGKDRFYHGLHTLAIGGLASFMAYISGSLAKMIALWLGHTGNLGLCEITPSASPPQTTQFPIGPTGPTGPLAKAQMAQSLVAQAPRVPIGPLAKVQDAIVQAPIAQPQPIAVPPMARLRTFNNRF